MFETRVLLQYVRCWGNTIALLRRPTLVVPFVALALIEAATLTAMANFTHPMLVGVMTPLLASLFGEEAVHYPTHALMLPQMMAEARYGILLIFGFIAFGWSVDIFADALAGEPIRHRRTAGRVFLAIPSLIFALALYVALEAGITSGAALLSAKLDRPKVQLVLDAGSFVSGTVLLGGLVYVVFYAVRIGRSPWASLRFAARTVARYAGVTMLVVGTALALRAPGDYLASLSGLFVETSRPQLVGAALLLGIVIRIGIRSFLFVSLTSVAAEQQKGTA